MRVVFDSFGVVLFWSLFNRFKERCARKKKEIARLKEKLKQRIILFFSQIRGRKLHCVNIPYCANLVI